jgi:hypothetical protein
MRHATPGALTEQGQTRRHRWITTAGVALTLVLAPAAVWALPAQSPLAQEDASGSAAQSTNQVIAQGITRLPKGDLAWTVRGFEVPGGEGTAIEGFPIGFAVADGATVAVQDEDGGTLGLLDDGEAVFLPSGKAGVLASHRGDAANLFEIALVAAEDAAAGTTPGTVVGNAFAPPQGRSFEIELARNELSQNEEAFIPISASGAPTLFLVTAGTIQLTPPGGQPVELAAGQYALLTGEVTARGAGSDLAAILVAAIGEATNETAKADGTPRAGRADGEGKRDKSAQGAGGGAKQPKQKKVKPPRTGGGGGGQSGGGGRGGQTQQPQTGDTGAPPVTGGVETPAAGTPPAEPVPTEEVPASPTVPDAETPAAEATPPADDVEQDDTTDDSDSEQDATDEEDEVVQEDTNDTGNDDVDQTDGVEQTDETDQSETDPAADDVEQVPVDDAGLVDESAEQTVPEETLPIVETPVEQAPIEEVPVEEVPVEEAPVEQVPAEVVPEGDQPVDPAAQG